jgi:ribosomal protein L29
LIGPLLLINAAIAEERRFNRAVLAEVVAEIRATTNDDLERTVRSLTVELADLKATLAEVRLAFATDRTQALDLPPLPRRPSPLQ